MRIIFLSHKESADDINTKLARDFQDKAINADFSARHLARAVTQTFVVHLFSSAARAKSECERAF